MATAAPTPGEGVDHHADQHPIAQAGQGTGVDRVDQGAGFIGLQYRGLAFLLRVLRPTHRVRRIGGDDLADHYPVEEHAQCGQPLLYRGLRMHSELRFDNGRHIHRLHLAEIGDPMLGAEARELPHRLAVGAAGIGIADMRAEEVAQPPAGLWLHREDRRSRGGGSY
jgi:hypothetical protein